MAQWSIYLHDLSTTRYPRLLAYATLLAGDRAAAEDLVQDALIRTFGRPRHLPTIGHAEAYVRRAILTLFLDSTRRRATLTRAFARLAEPAIRPDHSITVAERDRIERALADLA